MPADRDVAVRLVCRHLGAADEGGLPAYVRERLEREIRPLLASPLVAPDDPLVLQAAEAIVRDWRLLKALGREGAVLQALASIDQRLAAIERRLAPPVQAAPAARTQAPAQAKLSEPRTGTEPIIVEPPPESRWLRFWAGVKAFFTDP